MEVTWMFIVGGTAAVLLWFLFKSKRNLIVSPDIVPSMPYHMRRRRLSGGFYPLGYAGSYLPGEDLVDHLMWQAELAAMTADEFAELGEYGGEDYVQVEDPRESDEFVTEPVEEAPEAEEFVALDSVPEPEVVDEEDVLNDRLNNGGWSVSDDSDDSDDGWSSDED